MAFERSINVVNSWGWTLLNVGVAGILTVLVLYPLAVGLLGLWRREQETPQPERWPTVTGIVVMRNASSMVEPKVENCLSIDYPEDRIEWLFYSDGSTDDTVARARACLRSSMSLVGESRHLGKIAGLNRLAASATGEILLFTDADGILAVDSVKRLAGRFQDPRVGGVSGRRVLAREHKGIHGAQTEYIRFDSFVKLGESRLGGVTSNDGKLYVVRRSLFEPIPDCVTDDLYAGLTVVARGFRFLYDDHARVSIRLPSSDARHEITRRRRIVSTSLHGIFMRPELLNPLRWGWFALALFINKVLRRFLPVFLLLALSGLLLLAPDRPAAVVVLVACGTLAALGAVAGVVAPGGGSVGRHVSRWSNAVNYFLIGNLGTLLGLVDWVRGQFPMRWDPVKRDDVSLP